MFEVGRDSREMNIISKSDAHQEDPSSTNFSMLPDDLDSLSLGTTLRIKQGYSANYEQWVKTFNSCQKSDLLLDSTGYQCKQDFDIKSEESDIYPNDSGCEHGQQKTCCNGNKCTQENSCKLLNIKTLNSVDGVRKNGGEDNWSEKLTANIPENRIHKLSGFRQDIHDPSISLNGYNKQVNKANQLEAIKSTELQCEEPRTMMVAQQNPLLLKQNEQHKHVYDKGRDFRCKVYEDQESALKVLKPADVECVSHQNEVTCCCHAAGELIYNTTYSHFRELNPHQLKSESTQSTISKHEAQDNLDVTDDTTFKEWPCLNYNCAKQVRQMNAYICSSGDPSKPDNITSESCRNKEKTTCNGSSSSNKGNDTEIFFYSGKHLALLTYNLSAVVIVLALTVVYLYMRITSLEASRDVLVAQCHCGEKQPIILDKQIRGGNVDRVQTIETNQKLAVSPFTSTSLMVNNEEKASQRSDYKTNASDVAIQHPQVTQQSNKFTSSEKIVTNNMSQSTPDTEMASATTTSQASSRPEVTHVSAMLASPGASRFESSYGDQSAILSRVARSAPGNQSAFNKERQWNRERKNFCKKFNKGCKTHTDNFEGHFSRVINYKQRLMENECTSPEDWEPDIKACRGGTIIFPRQYSVLPFYLATTATAAKTQKKRLVETDDKGRFHIQKEGQYLIHVNISVVDPNGTHFLAVYLNNEAVLACPDGGFRCPNTNVLSSAKYRICNIIGLLQCRTNDTVDIRTMESNMTVRLEDTKKSHLSFVLLN